jgi:prepilin-type N-terminal cleavage/methylation domain-containing protein
MRNDRGFTLVEILISIIILGIIMTGFFQFFIFSQKTTARNQDKLVAINVAQKALEQIKELAQTETAPADVHLLSYWNIAHPDKTIVYPKSYDSLSESVDGKTYRVLVSIDTQINNGLQMVTVSVHDSGQNVSTVKGLVKLCVKED